MILCTDSLALQLCLQLLSVLHLTLCDSLPELVIGAEGGFTLSTNTARRHRPGTEAMQDNWGHFATHMFDQHSADYSRCITGCTKRVKPHSRCVHVIIEVRQARPTALC
eukprot:GHUV01034877.1.p1 GENE.GHUV01034877.1~~GHUV01034877.1.p1  ORF type:complete len:109 (-),score=5.55 GHUV01034877.1:162-488(-)